jgi:hypothetical protein
MVSTTAVPSALDQAATAEGLRNLAARPRLAQVSPELIALADAVDPVLRKDVHNWAGVDLFSAFLREGTVSPGRVWFGRILDIWVQVLFFVPIIVTWFGLYEATKAYRQAIKIKAFASESFLAGWQSGFHGNLSGAFSLDQVAIDVVLVIVVLVVSMIVQSVSHSLVDEDEPAKLYQELARLLTAAQLALAPVRFSSPTHIAEELHDASVEFAETATAIREVGEIAKRTQADAATGLTTVTGALAEVKNLATTVQASAGNVDRASQAMEQRLAGVASTTAAIAAAESSLVKEIGQHSTNLSASTNGLSDSIKNALAGSQQQMTAAVESSSTKIASALDAGADQIRSALAELSVAGAQYTHQVEQAADVLGLADDAVNKLPGSVAELQQRVAEVGDRIENLGKAITEAKDVMPTVTDIPADLRAALSELRAAAASLQAASVVLREGRLMAPQPRRRLFGRGMQP